MHLPPLPLLPQRRQRPLAPRRAPPTPPNRRRPPQQRPHRTPPPAKPPANRRRKNSKLRWPPCCHRNTPTSMYANCSPTFDPTKCCASRASSDPANRPACRKFGAAFASAATGANRRAMRCHRRRRRTVLAVAAAAAVVVVVVPIQRANRTSVAIRRVAPKASRCPTDRNRRRANSSPPTMRSACCAKCPTSRRSAPMPMPARLATRSRKWPTGGTDRRRCGTTCWRWPTAVRASTTGSRCAIGQQLTKQTRW